MLLMLRLLLCLLLCLLHGLLLHLLLRLLLLVLGYLVLLRDLRRRRLAHGRYHRCLELAVLGALLVDV